MLTQTNPEKSRDKNLDVFPKKKPSLNRKTYHGSKGNRGSLGLAILCQASYNINLKYKIKFKLSIECRGETCYF